jgi:hypothetical protein
MATTIDVYFGDNKFITFDEELAKEFLKKYNKVTKESKLSFIFYDIKVETEYAKYVIELLENNNILKKK